MLNPDTLARTIADAYARRTHIKTPSSEHASFDLATAYATEAALVRMRREHGRRTVGVKVGFANKAVWRVMKLDTLVWSRMYDDTVHHAADGAATLAVAKMFAPKIEPEIVFKVRGGFESAIGAAADPVRVLEHVESIAIGFEIIDCPFEDWKFQPADFVAAYGLHAALVVGDPIRIDAASIPDLAARLSTFTVRLSRDGNLVAEGSGRNSLRSPALCLAELGSAIARRADAEPLAPGDLVSTGTLTDSQPIAAGEVWGVEVDGLPLRPLSLTLTQG
jgi:2-oxo-3-hexenedioate decarboxylase